VTHEPHCRLRGHEELRFRAMTMNDAMKVARFSVKAVFPRHEPVPLDLSLAEGKGIRGVVRHGALQLWDGAPDAA
jgi:hypothetical protein